MYLIIALLTILFGGCGQTTNSNQYAAINKVKLDILLAASDKLSIDWFIIKK